MTDQENLINENENNEEVVSEWSTGWRVVPHGIEWEIKQSYIEYAMSVIVSRALPDTRDGFKPVLRRILYAMYDMKILQSSKHKKSARIVWEVLGKYHPHGDTSVYYAMVRMAQDFSMRYPLVDGQGNFGSIDGDNPAAMRYTEARLTKLAEEMVADIEQDTVDWKDNFDGSLQEPGVLPTKFPNHLCNGTMGIAVGMATNMAPHNLNEVIDASLLLIEKEGKEIEWEKYIVSIDEIMEIIKWPDFPTGGYIYDSENIKEVYRKGKGGIVTRGKTHVEDHKSGQVLVIDEIPYMLNKANLVAKIWELVVNKKIDGITDIRDESNKDKIRIAIYLRKGIDAYGILIQLYKQTDLQSNFNINNVSLVDDGIQPRLLNIKDLLMEYVTFRRQVVYRRSIYQLNKAKDRLHILEWLKKAIDIIDEVIETIKRSDTKADAKAQLMEKFDFSEPQAEYILLMRLQSLVGLEIQKIIDEIEEKKKLIEYLEGIINDKEKLDGVVKDEMNYIKEKYGDERRTELSEDKSVYKLWSSLKALKDEADKIKEDVIVWIGNDYSTRVLYQSRIQVIPEETLDLIYTHNQDKLIVITDRGELVVQRLKDLGSFTMKNNALDLKKHFELKGNIVFAKTLHFHYDHLVFLTDQNSIKKIEKDLLLKFKKFPTVVMNLKDGEKIVSVLPVSDWDHLCVVTEQWRGLLFPSQDLRPMWKTAGGVKAIELQEWDKVVNMFLHQDEPFVLVHGKKDGKLLSLEDLKIWKRARKGQVIMTGNDKLEGGISIVEWAIRIRFTDGSLKTLHSNDVRLDEPDTPLQKMVDKPIEIIYRPWEEKDENMKYKEERKKAELEAKRQAEESQGSLFDTSENNKESSDAKEKNTKNTEE